MEYNKEYFKNLLPNRPENSHKGTFGHVLNIAGSGFYTGAAYFSNVASLKVGCGRSTLASVQNVLDAISSLTPDVILLPLAQTSEQTISPAAFAKIVSKISEYQVVSVGCGLSTNKSTASFFEKLIKYLSKTKMPVVIDADGLTILGKKFKKVDLGENFILTPHPTEMSRLMGVDTEQIVEKPEHWVRQCCEKYNCTVVLKTHNTLVADTRGMYYKNFTGNSALAHGGSGDVLCGMISGFLSQGLNCFDASCLAVYLHGKIAEIASEELTEYSVLASDLLKYIPLAIKTIL